MPVGSGQKGPASKASWQAQLDDERSAPLHALARCSTVFQSPLSRVCSRLAADAELAAIIGQSQEMIEHYTNEVTQRKLALSAMKKQGW